MNNAPNTTNANRFQVRIARFLTGAGMPIFFASATLVFELFILAILYAPRSWGLWSSFSEQFKLWCFGYDPVTGHLEWNQVIIMMTEPLFVLAITIFLTRRSLLSLKKFADWKPHLSTAATGVACASLILTGMFFTNLERETDFGHLPFPGERIRTELIPPEFELVDQKGNPFTLEELKGDVVIVTAIYALCGRTCPQILLELRQQIEKLSPEDRANTSLVAITLNPELETQEQMNAFAEGYGFEYPEFRYLNGEPEYVRQLLKKLQFSRTEFPQYGYIEHSNLFLLIDSEGRIAYRLTLSDRHQSWLSEAIDHLVSEARDEKQILALNAE